MSLMQTSPSVGPPPEAWTVVLDFSGGAQPVYVGKARSVHPPAALTISAVSAAAAASFTSTAHGIDTDNAIQIENATGDWAAMNGTQKITRTGADTFTIAVNSSAFAGAFDGTVTTTAPRTSAAYWQILKQYYSGDANVRVANCNGSVQPLYVYDSRASYAYL
jgi:hypothetical protein